MTELDTHVSAMALCFARLSVTVLFPLARDTSSSCHSCPRTEVGCEFTHLLLPFPFLGEWGHGREQGMKTNPPFSTSPRAGITNVHHNIWS